MKKLSFILITFFILIFVFEWSGRIFISWRDYVKNEKPKYELDDICNKLGRMFVKDPDLGRVFKHDPNETFRTQEFTCDVRLVDLGVDSLFFRDDGINKDREKILLAVGDSFVFGYGVQLNEIFTERLEQMDKSLDVINAGIYGHIPQQYTRMIKKFSDSNIHFNGVLYNFFAGNDVWEEYSFREWSRCVKKFPYLKVPKYSENRLLDDRFFNYKLESNLNNAKNNRKTFLTYFFERWFVSFRIVKRLFFMIGGRMSLKDGLNPYYREAELPRNIDIQNGYSLFPCRVKVKGPNGRYLFLTDGGINIAACRVLAESEVYAEAETELNFPLAEESILEAKEICDRMKKDFYFIYIPSKEEVYADELCSSLYEPQRLVIRKEMNTMHNRITAFCRTSNIKMIDLTDECIRRKNRGIQLFYSIDGHFNADGHRMTAEVIYDYLKKDR